MHRPRYPWSIVHSPQSIVKAVRVPRYGLWSMVYGLLACVVFAVPALAALGLSTDHRALAFGLMQPGEEKVLAQSGTHHNEITCSSTSGNAWYLKISLVAPLASGGEEIPLERFQWQVSRVDGAGTVVNQSQFRPFSLFPDLVYLSAPGEAAGAAVRLQFRYSLKVPEAQAAGSYHTTVRFTLTEVL